MSPEMSLAERDQKLRAIADLQADEIDGYEAAARARCWFEGEKAAVLVRRRQLMLAGRLREGMR